MDDLRRRPLFTAVYETVDEFVPAGGTYLFASSEEERSQHVEGLRSRTSDLDFIKIDQKDDYAISVAGSPTTFGLRRHDALVRFLEAFAEGPVYLDMTGMSHSVWAPLVRVALALGLDLRVVYVEPRAYSFSKSPREGEFFELSESKRGVGPLPLFASLATTRREDVGLVALLGFEGARLKYLIEQVQPMRDRLFPVLGMPGFRPEYPFHAVQANGRTLGENGAAQALRFARANCPFSCYYVLTDILSENPALHLKVATIGTKPHALGAVLRAVAPPTPSVELVYDHVQRKAKRTTGTDHCLVYDVAAFVDSLTAD